MPSISNIPDEIWRRIFEIGVADYSPATDKQLFQVTALFVCRQWRDIIMGDPLLWNTIHFVPGRGCIPRTQVFLKRSLDTPLNIILPARADNYLPGLPSSASLHPAKRDDEISSFFDLIAPASHRWRSLDLAIFGDLDERLQPLWTDNVPFLENLRLNRVSSPSIFGLKRVLLPNVSLQLRTLSLATVSLDWGQFHCNRLVDLSLGPFSSLDPGPTASQMAGILVANASSLRSLAYRGYFQESMPISESDVPEDKEIYGKIRMEKLETLKLLADWNPLVLQLLECQLPVIRALEMNLSSHLKPPASLVKRLTTTPSKLEGVTDLTLGFTTMNSSRSWSFFSEALPRVETLRLMGHVVLDELVVNFLNRTWPEVKSFFISEAPLPMIKRLISDRQTKSSSKPLSIHLKIADSPIYEEDFVWIESKLAQWSVASVREQPKGMMMASRTIVKFNRSLLLKEAQRTEQKTLNLPRLRQL
ncbi:hypothetical protein CPB86DRAFT_703250 [Serendipita vermifera]|nr:hypothetical protein CPB86DRAFT_703250 [Serendipita vermifera]